MAFIQGAPMQNLLARHFENLLHLKAIADAGSFNRAAKTIGLSQPALTRSIHKLEAAVGAPLLTRVAKGVYPTECGRTLLEHIQTIDAELEQAATMLRVMKGRAGSQLACGGSFVPMSLLIQRAIKDFSEARTGLHVRLVENSTDNLLRMLRLGELELVVCPKMDSEMDGDLPSEVLVTERVGIFANSRNRLLEHKAHSLHKLAAAEKWIIPDRSGQLRQLLTREFARLAVEMPARFIETSSLTAARRLIGFTRYIAFSTSLLVAQDLLDGTTREVQGDWRFPTTAIAVFYRDQALSAAALFFLECLRRIAQSLSVQDPLSRQDPHGLSYAQH